jgi:hypothetical protein
MSYLLDVNLTLEKEQKNDFYTWFDSEFNALFTLSHHFNIK